MMSNPMDNLQFQAVQPNSGCTFAQNMPCDLKAVIQQARQNPKWLEQEVQRLNPQGYQMALQIRNSSNPMQMVMQMAQRNNVHPSILQFLGIR